MPEELGPVDVARLIDATEGSTGADLKRLVEDAKAIYAYDKARGVALGQTTDYFLRGVEAVKENKRHYETAEAHAQLRPQASMGGFFRSYIHSVKTDDDGDYRTGAILCRRW